MHFEVELTGPVDRLHVRCGRREGGEDELKTEQVQLEERSSHGGSRRRDTAAGRVTKGLGHQ